MPVEIRPADLSPTGLERTARLLAGAFPGATHLDAAYLAWDYHANPRGRAIAFDALDDGRLVAHLAGVAARARLDGVVEPGLVFQNAATLPSHQGRGLFVALGHEILRAGRDAGMRYGIAAPNRLSLRPFVERLGFQHVGALDVRVGLGPAPQPRPPRAPLRLESAWDAAGFAWRLARPDRPYRIGRAGADGAAPVYAHGGRLGIWIEVGRVPAAALPRSLPGLPRPAPLRAWIGLDPTRPWRRAPYAGVPVRLRPAPLHLAFADLRAGARPLATGSLRLCALDFDAF